MKNKKLLFKILISTLIIGITIFGYQRFFISKKVETIRTFEECVRAGYPVAESHPRQCFAPNRRTFTEELACPTIAPNTSKGKEECLKAAKELETRYPGCRYSEICEKLESKKADQVYQQKLEDLERCGPPPGAPGNWKCINGSWLDAK